MGAEENKQVVKDLVVALKSRAPSTRAPNHGT